MTGHTEDADAARLRDPAQTATRLDPVEVGQHGVEDDHGRAKRPDLDERVVAAGGRLDRERPIGQQLDEHVHDQRLVVHDEQAGPVRGTERKGGPSLRAQETLELVEVDAAVPPGRQIGAEVAAPNPASKRGDRDVTVGGRLPRRQVRGRHAFHFLHI